MLYSSWWTTKFLQVRRCRISVTKKAPEGCLGIHICIYLYMHIYIYIYIYIYMGMKNYPVIWGLFHKPRHEDWSSWTNQEFNRMSIFFFVASEFQFSSFLLQSFPQGLVTWFRAQLPMAGFMRGTAASSQWQVTGIIGAVGTTGDGLQRPMQPQRHWS